MKAMGLIVVAAALTWLLSWFMQYVASITLPNQHLHITSPESNRLALVTVLAAVVVMVAIMLIILMDGCTLFIVICFGGAAILAGIGWVAVHTFPGTTVATEPAQWIYGIVVVLWGILMWYIFLHDVTDALDEAIGD